MSGDQQIRNERKKRIDLSDAKNFLRILKVLEFRSVTLVGLASLIALSEVFSLLLLAAFINLALIGEMPTGFLGRVVTYVGFNQLGFVAQSCVCILIFFVRFIAGLTMLNFILLQSHKLQMKLRDIIFQQALQKGESINFNSRSGATTADLLVRQVNLLGKGIVEPTLRVFGEITILLMILAAVFVVSPLLLLFLAITITPIVLFYILKFKSITRQYGEVANASLEELSGYASVLSSGWRQLSVHGSEGWR